MPTPPEPPSPAKRHRQILNDPAEEDAGRKWRAADGDWIDKFIKKLAGILRRMVRRE
jgi:hypothetical protein